MTSEMIGAALRLLIVLPLVTALAYFFIKYGLARRSRIAGGSRRMRVVEQLPIGPKAFLTLVEVGGRYLLIAQHEKGVTVLKQMDGLPVPVAPGEKEIDLKDIFSTAAGGINLLGSKVSNRRSRE